MKNQTLKTKLRIQQLCADRGILFNGNPVSSGYALGKVCNIKSPHMGIRLWNGTNSGIGMATIDKLCVGLNCEPGDLFERIPVVKAPKAKPEVVAKTKPTPAKKKKAARK